MTMVQMVAAIIWGEGMVQAWVGQKLLNMTF